MPAVDYPRPQFLNAFIFYVPPVKVYEYAIVLYICFEIGARQHIHPRHFTEANAIKYIFYKLLVYRRTYNGNA